MKKAVVLSDAMEVEADEAAAACVFFCFFAGDACVVAALLDEAGAGDLRFAAALDGSASTIGRW